jgi:hypothetical protein
MKKRSFLLSVSLLVLPACGHKGDPLPPLRRTPPAPSGFRFSQRGDVLELEAVAPTASVDGVAYDHLSLEFLYGSGPIDLEKRGQKRVAIGRPGQKVVATLPLPAPGTLVRATVRAAWSGERGGRALTQALVVQPPLEAPVDLTASAAEEGVRLAWQGSLPKAVEPPSAGPRLPGRTFAPAGTTGAAPAPTTSLAPATAPATPPGPHPPEPASAPSGASRPPASAPTVPASAPAAEASAAATGRAGETTSPPADVAAAPPVARRNGFFVYRRAADASFGSPLGAQPLDSRAVVDAEAPLGERVCYVVRAVASTDPLIESAASNEVCLERRDTTPPATPVGLAVLPRAGALELLWSPSDESDLAGYRVYREAPGEPRRRLAEVAADKAAFLDEAAAKGATYRYTVTAFDRSGNESPPSEAAEGSLP